MFSETLSQAIEKAQSITCLGLDPFLDLMPPDWKAQNTKNQDPANESLNLIRLYLEEALKVAQGRVAAVKPQSAFFEAFGAPGVALFRDLISQAKAMGFLVIADVKRGDIGTTASAYAEAYLPLADAVTVNPYMGEDAVKPFIDQAQKHNCGVYILVRTSNPSATDFQDVKDATGRPLYETVALKVRQWGQNFKSSDLSCVGAVVGATWPEQGKQLRELMPDTPFLIPGYGAQGGSIEGVEACRRLDGQGTLVNSSRALLYAWRKHSSSNWQGALSEAIDEMNEALRPTWT